MNNLEIESKELTTADVATALGVSTHQVRVLAREKKVGRQITRGVWLFSLQDVEAMKDREKRGRPGKVAD